MKVSIGHTTHALRESVGTAARHLLAHHEHIGAPQVPVGRLAVEGILEERRHASCHSVAVEVVRLRLRVGFGTGKQHEDDFFACPGYCMGRRIVGVQGLLLLLLWNGSRKRDGLAPSEMKDSGRFKLRVRTQQWGVVGRCIAPSASIIISVMGHYFHRAIFSSLRC